MLVWHLVDSIVRGQDTTRRPDVKSILSVPPWRVLRSTALQGSIGYVLTLYVLLQRVINGKSFYRSQHSLRRRLRD